MAIPARVYDSAAAARRVQTALRKAEGYPKRGRHAGEGPHVRIPNIYHPGEPGWTDQAVQVERHPTRDEWAVPDVPKLRTHVGRPLDDGAGGTVTLTVAQVKTRDESWDPPVEEIAEEPPVRSRVIEV